jgi:spore germination protein YaaH
LLSVLASLWVVPVSAEPARPDGYVRWAYHIPDDPTSLESLRQRQGDLDYVGLHWAAVRADGSLTLKENLSVIALVRTIGASPLLSVYLEGGADAGHAVLATQASRARVIDALLGTMDRYDGISMDFEGMYAEDRDGYTRFMAELAERLRPQGKLVTIALSAKTADTRTGWAASHDFAGIAPHVDLAVLMSYGFRTARSEVPGSSAPMPWVEATLNFALTQIPREKLLLGVPLYGYDWNTTTGPPGRAVRYPDAIATAARFGAVVRYDTTQQAARFSYIENGSTREVWFEDRVTVDAKVALVTHHGLAGVATWRLGHEDPQVWQAMNERLGRGATASHSWYFAEGSTAQPFDSWILIQNPGSAPARARLTFMLEGGSTITRDVQVAPTSRMSLFVNQIVPNAAFSARIDSDRPVFAERAMYAGFDGHAVTAISAPSRTWYFAEGSTTPPFDTWILLQNPGSSAATARLHYLKEDGTSLVQTLVLSPNSRSSVYANQVLPNAAFSLRVESDREIIAERAMYRFPGNASTGVTGTAQPSQSWHFAGGLPTFRNVPVDRWLLLQNPNEYPVFATITLFDTEGQRKSFSHTLPATSRQSIFLNQIFASPSFGIQVEATGGIVVERSVFMGTNDFLGNRPQGAYATQGAPRLATAWVLPEGSTAPPFSETVSVLNPHSSPMTARFEFMLEDGRTVTREYQIQPDRVFDLELGSHIVPAGGVSTRVITSLPSVVERTMFWTRDGSTGAHNTVGIQLD